MASAELASLCGEFGLAHALWHLAEAGFSVFGEGSDALFAASIFGVELFVS